MSSSSKKILAAILVIVVLAIGFYLYSSTSPGQEINQTYSSESMGVVFMYPENFTLTETASSSNGDTQQPVILTLNSPQGRILIVPSVRPSAEIDKEKAFYEENLFKDPKTTNSRIAKERFSGFKSTNGFENALYTVYFAKNDTEGFTMRTEITASSSDALLSYEAALFSIFDTVSFK